MAATTIYASSLVEQFHALQLSNNQLRSVLQGHEKPRSDGHLAELAALWQIARQFSF
jgi:hypothetical protein